jgi:uncharacterized RDD family membrane protein YckC
VNLVVDSATGVDVSLPIAGPGARSFAFVIDWHIRVVLLLAWYLTGALLYNGRLSIGAPLEPDTLWFVGVVVPPAAIFVLYHFVLEIVMHGRTPGKRMAGVRIVTREGNTPSIGALVTRNVFRLIDSFPIFYSVGLIATMLTRDHVRIGDLAAGTLLVYDRTSAPLFPGSRAGALDAASAEVANELLQRWDTLDAGARHRLAERMLAHYAGRSDEAASPAPGDADLRARLQQLAQGTGDGGSSGPR